MSVDSTKPVDSELVSALPSYIRETRELANANEAAIGGDYSRQVSAVLSNTQFTVSQLNQVYTVNSPTAVILVLPEVTGAHAGTWVRIHKLGAGQLTITPGGNNVIAAGSPADPLVNSTASEAGSAFVEFECIASGWWMIAGILGTWS